MIPTQPPVNCHLVLPDGERIPLELIYDGVRGGQHIWVNAYPLGSAALIVGCTLHCDEVPARTSIEIRAAR